MEQRPALSLATVGYRLYRQRRMLVLVAALPLAGAVAGGWGLPLALAVAAAIIVLLVVLPASYIEAMAMSLTTGLMLSLVPLVSWLLGLADPIRVERAMPLIITAAGLIWFFLTLVLVQVLALMHFVSAGPRTFRSRATVPLPLEQAIDALVLRPDHRMAKRNCGPEEADGTFRVTLPILTVDPESFERMEVDGGYRARVLERDAGPDRLHVVTECLVGPRDRATSSVTVQDLRRDGSRTLYAWSEAHDTYPLLDTVTFWLRDGSADHLRAEVDGYLGRPSPTVAFGSQIGLIGQIWRGLRALGLRRKRPDGYPPF